MSKKFLPASMLTAVLVAGGVAVPVQAGHQNSNSAHDPMSEFMAHHGFMQSDAKQDSPAKLGVAISEVSQAVLDRLSLEYGVRVEKVMKGSIAETAGLQPGDVVTAIDDRPAYSPARLQHLVGEASGASTVTVSRDGESLQVKAAFAEPQTGKALLGVRIQEMTGELKEAFGTEGNAGVLISQVVSGSAAKQAGLKAGDVIVSLGQGGVTAVQDVYSLLDGYSPGDSIEIAFVRDREKRVMEIALGGAPQIQSSGMHPHGMPGPVPGHGGYGHGFHGSHGFMPKHGCGMSKGQRRS
ncbi:MAG: PDZ domain-containing protein [Sedimenticolaceae bacterium]